MATNGKRGCLAVLFGRGASAPEPEAATTGPVHPAFRLRDDFLSPAELSFFRSLEPATRGRFVVFPKVNLKDLFYSPTGNIGDQNRISQKHADFVLWDARADRPVLGIELDDSSHGKEKATKRDAVKDAAFASAGLSLLRIRARESYVPDELRASIDAAIAAVAAPSVAAAGTQLLDGPPVCPKCGIPMVVRDGSRGRFYGCSNYPRCRERRPMPSG